MSSAWCGRSWIFLNEAIELCLLLQEVLRRWLGRLLLQRQMHALMPAVLLKRWRMAPRLGDKNFAPRVSETARACSASFATVSVAITARTQQRHRNAKESAPCSIVYRRMLMVL